MTQEQLELARNKATEALAILESGDQVGAEATFAEAQALVAEASATSTEVIAPVQMTQTLPQDVVTLSRDQYQLILQRQERMEHELQSAKVKELCDAALARGVPPVIVNTISPILMACQRDAQGTIRLTADAQQAINLFDAVATILTTCPGRLGEVTLTDTGFKPAGAPKPVTVEQAEELARKRRKELGIKSAIETDVEL